LALEAIGTLKVTTAGDYIFKISHDDSAYLYVDNVLVSLLSDVSLSAGNHALRGLYENGNGGARWTIWYKGPDTSDAYQFLES